MKRLISIMIICVPLIAQVGRYELHKIRPSLSDIDRLFLLDTQTGSIYELNYIGSIGFFINVALDGNEIYSTHFKDLDSSDIEAPTLSQIEAIEELWRRYKANPIILNDEDVDEVEKLRKRWGLVEPGKP